VPQTDKEIDRQTNCSQNEIPPKVASIMHAEYHFLYLTDHVEYVNDW